MIEPRPAVLSPFHNVASNAVVIDADGSVSVRQLPRIDLDAPVLRVIVDEQILNPDAPLLEQQVQRTLRTYIRQGSRLPDGRVVFAAEPWHVDLRVKDR